MPAPALSRLPGIDSDPFGQIRSVLTPLNGSALAERALPVTEAVAGNAYPIDLVSVVARSEDIGPRDRYLAETASTMGSSDVSWRVRLGDDPLEALADACESETLPVMATSGHIHRHDGHVGSAAETVVRLTRRPVMLIGERCEIDRALDVSRVVVPIDGSKKSEEAIPLAAAWAERLEVPLWLVAVLSEKSVRTMMRSVGDDARVVESNHIRHLARTVERPGRRVEWEVLHDDDPASAIAHATRRDSLVVMTTHARTGWKRVTAGSVSNRLVRESIRPVVVFRPPSA